MTAPTAPSSASARWVLPFLVGDVILLAAAFAIYHQATRPMVIHEVAAFAACVALGAWLGVWPFVLRHRAEQAAVDRSDLAGTLAQIGQLEEVATRIAAATGQWQTVQEHANRAVEGARQIAERMSAETREFMTFAQQANEAERSHLRLEVEKLRRAESDWLQVLVRILDHVHALFAAAVRSGQQTVVEQVGLFQNACRDTSRRVGLMAFIPEPGVPFDAKVHQLGETDVTVPLGAVVAESLAAGYTYQGQLLRPALVTIQSGASAAAAVPTAEDDSGTVAGEAADWVPGPKPGTLAQTAPPSAPAPARPTGPAPVAQDNLPL